MTEKLKQRLISSFFVALVSICLLFLYLSNKKDNVYAIEEDAHTVEVFFDIASNEKRLIEMEVDITYQRYDNLSSHFVLSPDEAGDRAFGTVLIVYRTAASKIPFSELITEEGKELLNKRVWEEIVYFNNSFHEPVQISGVNVKKMTPDPDAESAGRPAIFFLNEESGDSRAGI